MKKSRILSSLIVISLLFSLLVSPAAAFNKKSITSEQIIPQNVAELIASCFIRDYIGTPDSTWTQETKVSNSVPMYDTSGNVSAYTFELEKDGVYNGYVVVSTYPGEENVIKEFSDTAKPIYENLNLNSNENVVYTGAFGYYKDNGSNSLIDVNGVTVEKSRVKAAPRLDIAPLRSDTIKDPIEYANRVYGGNFVAYEYRNVFENYCIFFPANSSTYNNCCGPTAITNLITLKLNYMGENKSYDEARGIFNQVVTGQVF